MIVALVIELAYPGKPIALYAAYPLQEASFTTWFSTGMR